MKTIQHKIEDLEKKQYRIYEQFLSIEDPTGAKSHLMNLDAQYDR